jgi:hypothetical protein
MELFLYNLDSATFAQITDTVGELLQLLGTALAITLALMEMALRCCLSSTYTL